MGDRIDDGEQMLYAIISISPKNVSTEIRYTQLNKKICH